MNGAQNDGPSLGVGLTGRLEFERQRLRVGPEGILFDQAIGRRNRGDFLGDEARRERRAAGQSDRGRTDRKENRPTHRSDYASLPEDELLLEPESEILDSEEAFESELLEEASDDSFEDEAELADSDLLL